MVFENYGSFHGAHTFTFADRGTTLILGRNLDDPRTKSNGAGKSTIGDALEWCFFGVVPRDDTADSVINDVAGKGLSVTVQVQDDDGKIIQIQRTRGVKSMKDGPRVWLNGGDLTKLDASATQEVIERLLGLDQQVFRAAVFFAQGERFCFADAKPSERDEILTKVLQLGDLDRCAEILEKRLKDEEFKLVALDAKLNSVQANIQHWNNAHVAAAQRHVVWAQGQQHHIAQVQQQLQQVDAHLAQMVPVVVPEMPQPQPVPPPAAMRDIDNQLQKMDAQAQQLDRDIGEARGRYSDLKRRADTLIAKGVGTCGECGQAITAQHIEAEKARMLSTLEAMIVSGKALGEARAQVDLARQQLVKDRQHLDAQWQAAKQKQAADLAVARQTVQHAQQQRQLYEQALAHRNNVQASLLSAQNAKNPEDATLSSIHSDLNKLHTEMNGLVEQRAQLLDSVTHLRFWKTGFGAKGLKSYVLDSRLEEMTIEANRWVQLLTGGAVWVRFETQKQVGVGKKAKLVNEFNVRVFRHNPDGTTTERNFKSWSGGEKHRIALGIDFALARLIANRAKRRYNMLILDEVFQKSLDSSGKEAVAEMLQHLAQEKSSIFVIDHDVIFQGLFETTVVVEKKLGCSRIVEGT